MDPTSRASLCQAPPLHSTTGTLCFLVGPYPFSVATGRSTHPPALPSLALPNGSCAASLCRRPCAPKRLLSGVLSAALESCTRTLPGTYACFSISLRTAFSYTRPLAALARHLPRATPPHTFSL